VGTLSSGAQGATKLAEKINILNEALVLKKREEQRFEEAQMKFLRQLLGITKLDKEKNLCIRQKTGYPEQRSSRGNKIGRKKLIF